MNFMLLWVFTEQFHTPRGTKSEERIRVEKKEAIAKGKQHILFFQLVISQESD